MDAESLLLHVDYSIRQLREFANVSRALDGLECVREALLWELRFTLAEEALPEGWKIVGVDCPE